MDILLTHGYFLYDDPHELAVMKPYPPLGLLYISAHLKARGLAVSLFDSTFSSLSELEAQLKREHPPVVGIYANLMTRVNVLRVARLAKAAGSLVVVGGPDPANYLDEYLSRDVDVIAIGEGELTLEELVPALLRDGLHGLQEVHGIAYRSESGAIVRTEPREMIPDLDAQPFPDRAGIDQHEYVRIWREHHGQGSVSLITARGCPYTCTWCSHAVFGYSHRRRSPANVVAEVEHIVGEYKPDLLWYADDVFTINHKWLYEYADQLQQRGLRVPFETISREDRLNEEIVETLARMGCYRLWIGAESGSQRVLDAMKRRTDADRVKAMVHLLQRHGIEVGMFIMLGYEGEERSDIEATVAHLKAAGPDTFLTTVAYPIKGTPYYTSVADRVVARRDWATGSDRDLTVLGRHSDRYYQFATRWMVSEVALGRMGRQARLARSGTGAGAGAGAGVGVGVGVGGGGGRVGGLRRYPRMAKTYLSAQVGRIGMLLTERERQTVP